MLSISNPIPYKTWAEPNIFTENFFFLFYSFRQWRPLSVKQQVSRMQSLELHSTMKNWYTSLFTAFHFVFKTKWKFTRREIRERKEMELAFSTLSLFLPWSSCSLIEEDYIPTWKIFLKFALQNIRFPLYNEQFFRSDMPTGKLGELKSFSRAKAWVNNLLIYLSRGDGDWKNISHPGNELSLINWKTVHCERDEEKKFWASLV